MTDDENADFIWKHSEHAKVFSVFPRTCRVSGESLWLKKAYRCRFYDRSGLYEDDWYSQKSYVWKTLKGG